MRIRGRRRGECVNRLKLIQRSALIGSSPVAHPQVSAPWGHDGLVYRTRAGAGCACGPLACAAPPCVSSHAPSWSKWIPCSGNGALIAKAAADVEMRTAGRTFCADTGGFWPPRYNQSEQRSSVFSSSRKYQCCIPADKSSGSVSSDESTDVYLDPSAPLRLMMSILSLFSLWGLDLGS